MDFVKSHLEKIKLWPVEHFWLVLIWKKSEPKLVRVSFFRSDFLKNPYFSAGFPREESWKFFVSATTFEWYTALALWRVINVGKDSLSLFPLWYRGKNSWNVLGHILAFVAKKFILSLIDIVGVLNYWITVRLH